MRHSPNVSPVTSNTFNHIKKKKSKSKVSTSLLFSPSSNPKRGTKPAWDNSIHDLSVFKLSPKQIMSKKRSMQSKNLDVARRELEGGSSKTQVRKQTTPPRPKSAPVSRMRTVSPIITKASDEPLNISEPNPIDIIFSLDEEQFMQDSMNFRRDDVLDNRQNTSISEDEKSIIISKPAIDFDLNMSSGEAWSEALADIDFNGSSDRIEKHQFEQNIKKLDNEHADITLRLRLIEYESQVEQGKGKIFKLEESQRELEEKLRTLEVALSASRAEADRTRREFDQFKIDSEKEKAELREQVSKMNQELEDQVLDQPTPALLSTRTFHIPTDESNADDSTVTPRFHTAGKTTSPPVPMRTPPVPEYSFGSPSPIRRHSPQESTNSMDKQKPQHPFPKEVSPYVTYLNKAPSPHPHPRYPKVENLAEALREPTTSFRFSDQNQMIYHEKKPVTIGVENTPPRNTNAMSGSHSVDVSIVKPHERGNAKISTLPSPIRLTRVATTEPPIRRGIARGSISPFFPPRQPGGANNQQGA